MRRVHKGLRASSCGLDGEVLRGFTKRKLMPVRRGLGLHRINTSICRNFSLQSAHKIRTTTMK